MRDDKRLAEVVRETRASLPPEGRRLECFTPPSDFSRGTYFGLARWGHAGERWGYLATQDFHGEFRECGIPASRSCSRLLEAPPGNLDSAWLKGRRFRWTPGSARGVTGRSGVRARETSCQNAKLPFTNFLPICLQLVIPRLFCPYIEHFGRKPVDA